MNKKIFYLILLLFLYTINSVSLYAYNNDNSFEYIEYEQTLKNTETSTAFAQLSSFFKVIIPKTVVLSGSSKSANYIIKVEGDIAGYETISVIPEESFKLFSVNKNNQDAFVSQDKNFLES